MENKTDSELIMLVRNKGDSDSFKEICRRYENLFYNVCQKYSSVLTANGISVNDIFDEKNYIIYHCVSTYKPNKKTKLSTWIGNYARYLCLNSINSRKSILSYSNDNIKSYIENSQIKNTNIDHNLVIKDNYNLLISLLSNISDKRIINIFELRYKNDKKMVWAKIAKKMNLSTQTVLNLHNKGVKYIKIKLKSQNS